MNTRGKKSKGGGGLLFRHVWKLLLNRRTVETVSESCALKLALTEGGYICENVKRDVRLRLGAWAAFELWSSFWYT